MKQFIIRTDNFPAIEDLSYEERGKLLTILMLNATDNPTQEQLSELRTIATEFVTDRALNKSLMPFQRDFEEDKAKYDKIVARNRANGCKGGRPRKTQSVNNPSGFEKPRKPTETSIYGYSIQNNLNIIENKNTPTLEEVLSAAQQLCVTADEAEKFFYHYDAEGWLVNGRPIINWRSKLMQWKNNSNTYNNANTNTDASHSDFIRGRNQTIADATRTAIELSQRGVTREVDLSIL